MLPRPLGHLYSPTSSTASSPNSSYEDLFKAVPHQFHHLLPAAPRINAPTPLPAKRASTKFIWSSPSEDGCISSSGSNNNGNTVNDDANSSPPSFDLKRPPPLLPPGGHFDLQFNNNSNNSFLPTVEEQASATPTASCCSSSRCLTPTNNNSNSNQIILDSSPLPEEDGKNYPVVVVSHEKGFSSVDEEFLSGVVDLEELGGGGEEKEEDGASTFAANTMNSEYWAPSPSPPRRGDAVHHYYFENDNQEIEEVGGDNEQHDVEVMKGRDQQQQQQAVGNVRPPVAAAISWPTRNESPSASSSSPTTHHHHPQNFENKKEEETKNAPYLPPPLLQNQASFYNGAPLTSTTNSNNNNPPPNKRGSLTGSIGYLSRQSSQSNLSVSGAHTNKDVAPPIPSFSLALQVESTFGPVLLRCVLQAKEGGPVLLLSDENGENSELVPLSSSSPSSPPSQWSAKRTGARTFSLKFDGMDRHSEFLFLTWTADDCSEVCNGLSCAQSGEMWSPPQPTHCLLQGRLETNDSLDSDGWSSSQVQLWNSKLYLFHPNNLSTPRTVLSLGYSPMSMALEMKNGFVLEFKGYKIRFRAQNAGEQRSWVAAIRREHILRLPSKPPPPPSVPPPPSLLSVRHAAQKESSTSTISKSSTTFFPPPLLRRCSSIEDLAVLDQELERNRMNSNNNNGHATNSEGRRVLEPSREFASIRTSRNGAAAIPPPSSPLPITNIQYLRSNDHDWIEIPDEADFRREVKAYEKRKFSNVSDGGNNVNNEIKEESFASSLKSKLARNLKHIQKNLLMEDGGGNVDGRKASSAMQEINVDNNNNNISNINNIRNVSSLMSKRGSGTSVVATIQKRNESNKSRHSIDSKSGAAMTRGRAMGCLVSEMPGDAAVLRRVKVLQELLSSEKTYSNGLKQLRAARNSIAAKHIKQAGGLETVDVVFRDVPYLCAIHSQLVDELEDIISDSSMDASIGQALCAAFHSATNLYERYAAGADDAREALSDLLVGEGGIAAAKVVDCPPDKVHMVFDSLLILAIQRPPRYVLLLQELLRCTDADFPDFLSILQAYNMAKDICEGMNKEKQEVDNKVQLKNLIARCTFKPKGRKKDLNVLQNGFLKRSRALIREGPVIKMRRGRNRNAVLVLLSDMLLIARPVGKEGGSLGLLNEVSKLCIRRIVDLKGMQFRLISGSKEDECSFAIIFQNKTLAFKAPSPNLRNFWAKDISDAIAKIRQGTSRMGIHGGSTVIGAQHYLGAVAAAPTPAPAPAAARGEMEAVVVAAVDKRQHIGNDSMTRDVGCVLQRLLGGSLLTKFSRKTGEASIRWVVLSPDLKSLYWSRASSHSPSAKDRKRKIKLKKIEYLRYGATTPTFFLSDGMMQTPDWLCFSVGLPQRTVDFAAKNLAEVADWYLGLQGLLALPGTRFSQKSQTILDEDAIERRMLELLNDS